MRGNTLPKEETKRRAWSAIYNFLEYVSPLLCRYNINEVLLALCGSVHRGEAKCPRDKDTFCEKLKEAVKIYSKEIYYKDGLPLEYLKQIIEEYCSKYNSTDEIIKQIEKNFPNTLFLKIAKDERCSDVDGKIIVPDDVFEVIIHDPDYTRFVEEGNEYVRDIVYPLTPEIGFVQMSICEKLKTFERCEVRKAKINCEDIKLKLIEKFRKYLKS